MDRPLELSVPREQVEKKSLISSALHHGRGSLALDLLSFAAVSAQLAGVLGFLAVTGRLTPNLSLRGAVAAALPRVRRGRPLTRRRMRHAFPERGYCYRASLPWGLESDQEGRSRLLVYEDGRLLGPAHALHETVRTQGRGAYSHWGRGVYFSTSDNQDPRMSGRVYEISEEQ